LIDHGIKPLDQTGQRSIWLAGENHYHWSIAHLAAITQFLTHGDAVVRGAGNFSDFVRAQHFARLRTTGEFRCT
jgi:hypothetical protein